MLEKSKKNHILAFILFLLILDSLTIRDVVFFEGEVLPRTSGNYFLIFFGITIALIFFVVGRKAKQKNEKTALYLFGFSRMISINKSIFAQNFGLNLGTAIFVFCLDIVIMYEVIAFYKKFPSSTDESNSSIKPLILLLAIIGAILLVFVFFYFLGVT